jgi:hypothetical protein
MNGAIGCMQPVAVVLRWMPGYRLMQAAGGQWRCHRRCIPQAWRCAGMWEPVFCSRQTRGSLTIPVACKARLRRCLRSHGPNEATLKTFSSGAWVFHEANHNPEQLRVVPLSVLSTAVAQAACRNWIAQPLLAGAVIVVLSGRPARLTVICWPVVCCSADGQGSAYGLAI